MMLLTVALLAPPLVFILMAKRGRKLFIRRIPGIDAIEEAIGRSTELGRPMVFSTGLTGLDSLLYALLGIISHVGRKAAAYGCRLIVPQRDYEVLPVVTETVREAFRAAGRIDAFNPQDIRFLSPEQFAYASGYMGMVHREKAASCFLFGEFAAESLVLAEAGQQVGAMQVAGTVSNNQVPFFLTSCDYTLIGEEVYAAGAYLSREPAQLGSVRGQDAAKLVILALILFGVVAGTVLSAQRQDPREGEKFTSWFARALYHAPQQKAVLADIEVVREPNLPAAPERRDIEEDLARSRRSLADSAAEAARLLRAGGRDASRLTAWLRGSLAGLEPAEARAEAENLAGLLEASAARCRDEAGKLDALARKELPAAAAATEPLRAKRAAEAARPELKLLGEWIADCRELVADNGKAPLTEAARAVEAASSAPEIDRGMTALREACHRAYFTAVRRHMEKVAAAGRQKTPTFLGDLKEHGLGLTLDGTGSVSGRLLQLSYRWNIDPAPGGKGAGKLVGQKANAAFTRPGRYRVDLEASEVPAMPRPIMLALLTNDPTSVRHETIASGTELKLAWRLPGGTDAASTKIKWDFGDGSPAIAGEGGDKLDGIGHRYTRTGNFLMEVTVSYKRKLKAGAGESGARAAAEEAVPPRLAEMRSRLRDGLSELGDALSAAEERFAELAGQAAEYSGTLKDIEGATDETWPDRKFAADLVERIKALGEWQAAAMKDIAGATLRAGRLGAPAPAPSAAEAPTAAAGPAGGDGNDKVKPQLCWNRFRTYWTVVEPLRSSTFTHIEIGEIAPLPRAPWEPRPAAPEPAPAAPANPEAEEGNR
jgi:hypothetical protein